MTGDIMTSSIRLALTLAISLAMIPAAFAASPTKTGKTDKGTVLTDAKGMSLYTFDKDADGKSACNGPCATNWPALKAEASDAGRHHRRRLFERRLASGDAVSDLRDRGTGCASQPVLASRALYAAGAGTRP
jgi:predicted lipoprotein with Yx(FWY)xxD motif